MRDLTKSAGSVISAIKKRSTLDTEEEEEPPAPIPVPAPEPKKPREIIVLPKLAPEPVYVGPKWRCPKCTVMNPSPKTHCGMCGIERPFDVLDENETDSEEERLAAEGFVLDDEPLPVPEVSTSPPSSPREKVAEKSFADQFIDLKQRSATPTPPQMATGGDKKVPLLSSPSSPF